MQSTGVSQSARETSRDKSKSLDAQIASDFKSNPLAIFRGAPSTVRNFMTSSGCSMRRGPLQKKANGTNRTGGSIILKWIWGGNLLYFPGFGDLQPYEKWKFRICSESVSGFVPDFTPEMLKPYSGHRRDLKSQRFDPCPI